MKLGPLATIAMTLILNQSLYADERQFIEAETEIGVSYNNEVERLGFEASVNTKSIDGNIENTNEKKIMIRPALLSSSNGLSIGGQIELDVFGTNNKKVIIGSTDSLIQPYFHSKSSGLTYKSDGIQGSGSFTLLDMGVGVGGKIKLTDKSEISAHGGVGMGLEFGRRYGILDPSIYTKVEGNIEDLIHVAAGSEIRSSLLGPGYESRKGAEVSLNINDLVRAGVEFERSQNHLGNDTRYDTNYGGLKVSGIWGAKKK